MPTRAELDRIIRRDEARVARLEASAASLRALIEETKRLRDSVGTNEVLHKRLRPASVNEPTMEKSHRLAISEGHADSGDDFAKAVRNAGFSQNGLAKRLRINQAILSLHRKGIRKIPLSRAHAIEKLIGWKADAAHWPVGIKSDEE